MIQLPAPPGLTTALHVPIVLALALIAPSGAGAQAPAEGAPVPVPPAADAVPVAAEPTSDATPPQPSQPPTEAAPVAVAADPQAAPAPADGELAAQVRALSETVQRQQQQLETLEVAGEQAAMSSLIDDDASEALLEERPVHLYGFMDFGFDKFFFPDDESADIFGLLRDTDAATFVFGNLNLYISSQPLPQWRNLIELRFTLAPHGEEIELLGGYSRTDTVAFDYASPSTQTQMQLGGVVIERAWSQWTFDSRLEVRWGYFLNPFGIWNVDHGSPVLISLMVPTFVASRMIPSQLLGLQVHGSFAFGDYELGYRAHVSNGRTLLNVDQSDGKALGSRLFLAHDGSYGRVVIGTSNHFGRVVDKSKSVDLGGGDVLIWEPVVDYDEMLLAGDIAVDFHDVFFRSEAVFRWVVYEGTLREPIQAFGGDNTFLPNRLEYNAYGLLGYRLWDFEPYASIEVQQKSFSLPRWAGEYRNTQSNTAAVFPSVGFNYRFTPYTQFKLQLALIQLYDEDLEVKDWEVPVLFTRLVSSF